MNHKSSKTNESQLNDSIVIPVLTMMIVLGWIIVLLVIFKVAASLLRHGQGSRGGEVVIPEVEVLINFYEL